MCCTQIGLTPFLLEKSNEACGIVNSSELCICASALDNKVWPSILKLVQSENLMIELNPIWNLLLKANVQQKRKIVKVFFLL